MNAAQAMGGSGDIRVGIERRLQRFVISIADHGPGMPHDVREKIFEPFFTTKHRGTGLGLPIAQRIVEAHGGDRDRQPGGRRTTVLISLPAK
jgi:signal transduction histidine kinase